MDIMRKLSLFVLFAALSLPAYGSVKLQQTSSRQVLENRFLKAEFSDIGGQLLRLTDKISGKLLTDGDGAFRDQFPPVNAAFAQAEYRRKIIKNSDREAILEFASPALTGKNQFTFIIKRYRLKADEALLHVQVEIQNQLESMAEKTYEYWSNSYFGIPGEENDIFVPLKKGVLQEKSGSNRFFREPVRSWFAIMGKKSRTAAILLTGYRQLQLFYSWNCIQGKIVRNTLEFRCVPEAIQPGASFKTSFAIAVANGLTKVSGASATGCGSIVRKGDKAEISLYGFCNFQGFIRLDNGQSASPAIPVTLLPGKITKVALPCKNSSGAVRAVIVDAQKKFCFDLLLSADGASEFLPPCRRNQPPKDPDPSQYTLKNSVQTPHFKWLDSLERFRALFLLGANGGRDVIELNQRMNFDFDVPTIFPGNWAMSWRIKTNYAAGSAGGGGKSDTQNILPFLKNNYDVYVIGGSMTTAETDGKRMTSSSFSAYPAAVRRKILQSVSNGAGLLLLNPDHPDKEMKKILSSLKDAKALFSSSMSFSAAPYFDRSSFGFVRYGKGRIMVIKYPTICFLAPLLKMRHRYFQHLKCDHRYWEYQFAILARAINFVRGKELIISGLSAQQDGSVSITVSEKGTYRFELFDRYSQSLGSFTRDLVPGENRISALPLISGTNYLHVTLPGKDFAYTALNKAAVKSRIVMKNSFEKGEMISGSVVSSKEHTLKLTVTDNLGRLIYRGSGNSFNFPQDLCVTNRHLLRAEFYRKGKLEEVVQQEFYTPGVFDFTRNYTNLCWVGADMFPEYSYPARYEQLRQFGFNYLYGGMFNDASPQLLRYANCEVGMNWYASGAGLHQKYPHVQQTLKKWSKSENKLDLIRIPCLNDPALKTELPAREPEYSAFASRNFFQLGDEMSMTFYQMPIDYCFCKHCLKKFREYLKAGGLTLEELNRTWKSSYKSFDEVLPQTFNETIFAASPAGFVAHRLFMDKVFKDKLLSYRAELRKKYPGALAGPTGVANPPHPYGGNWNFWNMRELDCASFYGIPRIPLSFNRDKRFIMCYRGYSSPENEMHNSFWEGLFAGERNSNNWFCPIFLLPDLRHSEVRNYYKELLWELRSGVGDLLFHAKKSTEQAAILHSQTSLIANFLKQNKQDYFLKELSFARLLEDLGISYRFISPEELEAGILDNFKLLILPESSALSDRAIEKIKLFSAKGNKLIADYDCALMYDNCNVRTKPALNELFGISSSRAALRKVKSHTLKGITISHAVRNIKIRNARALGSAQLSPRGKTPLAIAGRNTLYLNFAPQYESRRESALRQLVDNFLKMPSQGRFFSSKPVMHSYFTDDKALYIALLAQPDYPNWRNRKLADAGKYQVSGTFKLAKAAHLYDVRKGKYLGYGKTFKISLVPGDGTLLAALPARVKAVKINAPAAAVAGKPVDLSARVSVYGKTSPGKHILLLRFFAPDGKENISCRQILPAEKGIAKFRFPAAFNDCGRWKIIAKDAASGMTSEVFMEIKESL